MYYRVLPSYSVLLRAFNIKAFMAPYIDAEF
jgi:hypothetical protein